MPTFGEPHHHFELTDSTNLQAKELADAGAPSGTVVTADEQSAGRGRTGRVWTAPPASALLYSAILRPLDLSHVLLPLAVPLAVSEACEALADVECGVKWPNDVWVSERKLAGVLIEARPPEWAVIGVGINLSIADHEFPDDLRTPATSLGNDVTTEQMREALNLALARWVSAPRAQVRQEFARRDALFGHEISWEDGTEGTRQAGAARGIDEDGNLLVAMGDGTERALGSGEVRLLSHRDD